MKNLWRILVVIILAGSATSALAQSGDELRLRLSRTFGYSSGAGKIQGIFTLKASGPEDLQEVVFYLDGQALGVETVAPFQLQINTDDYALGVHTLSAEGMRADGRRLLSNDVRVEIVTAQAGMQSALRIVGPMLAIIFAAIGLSFTGLFLSTRKAKPVPLGAPRRYGLKGGAICPRCARPFPLSLLSLNLGLHKLDRCPHCGKWSLLRRRPLAELRQAEAAEVEMVAAQVESISSTTAEEKLHKELEATRFQDL